MHPAIKKMLHMSVNEKFELGVTLQGIVIDWSVAEIRGLGIAVGKGMAERLLKGRLGSDHQ